jgi:hypothetical protein
LVVNPVQPDTTLTLTHADPPHPCIYQGDRQAGILDKLNKIHRYSRVWMYFKEENAVTVTMQGQQAGHLVPNTSAVIRLSQLMALRASVLPPKNTNSRK